MKRLIVVFFAFCFSFQGLQGCECKTMPLTITSIEKVELIFLGDVVAISGCDETAKVSFHVKELYRGKCFAETTIEFDCSSDCQMSFSPGQTWIIYANYKKYGEANVDFCSYSRQLFADETKDFNSTTHGMTFSNEQKWLIKNFQLQKLNEKDQTLKVTHENIRPDGFQLLGYLGAGLIGLMLIYIIGKKISN